MAIVAHGYGRPGSGPVVTGGYGLTAPPPAPGDGIDLEVIDTGHVAIIRDHGHLAALFDTGHRASIRDDGHAAALFDTGHRITVRDIGHTTTARQPWQS